ncbi:hypothetical protein BC628DRAFT_1354592 [Trametes gibbosa]|nr:hypothetical protein BC628DRAFT_1354592 [Trametes gibbosa]
MSEQAARAHTSSSNRAKTRDHTNRKVIFKSVVDNPFHIQWYSILLGPLQVLLSSDVLRPHIPTNIQNAILACMVEILTGVADYNLSRERTSRRKRKRLSQDREVIATLKEPSHPEIATEDKGYTTQTRSADTSINTPLILGSLVVGINEVTKRLEALANSHRRAISVETDERSAAIVHSAIHPPRGCLVIVCRGDVDPPALINHIPNLVAACNSRRYVRDTAGCAWLVSLPKGAEFTLAAAVGLRRACIMLIQDPAACFPALVPLLQSVPLLVAPWLESYPSSGSTPLVATHIKQLRTTAPKDMKAAKDKRARERAAAKERRKHKSLPKRLTLSS